MEPDTHTDIPSTIQQAPVQTQMPEKHNSPILLWLLILALVGVASYFGYQYWQLKQQMSRIQPTPTPMTTPTTTPNPTVNWKTYTYEKYGYSFKYPSEYVIEEKAPGFLVITAPGEHVAQAGISIESRLTGPYANYVNAKNVITSANTLSETKTAGNWEIFQGIGKDGMLKGVEFRFGIAPYKTGAIEAETLANTQYVKIFDQILSTFKFVYPTPTTSGQIQSTQIPGWKYYSSDDFTFQYPGDWTIGQGGQALVADTAGAGATIFGKDMPMYNECMKLDKTDTVDGKMVKYYSYTYSGEACSNQANIGNYEVWITKAGGDGFQPGIIYSYNTTIFPKSFDIFKQILSTFVFIR